jgi:hypothetical protein
MDGPRPTFSGFTAGFGITAGIALFDVAYIRESGSVPLTKQTDGGSGGKTMVRYNRLFASVMLRFGERR